MPMSERVEISYRIYQQDQQGLPSQISSSLSVYCNTIPLLIAVKVFDTINIFKKIKFEIFSA